VTTKMLYSAATELGSEQPFLRFFQVDREGRGRACYLWNCERGGEGMIRNDKEYRHTKERLIELEAELQKLSKGRRSAERGELASAVIDALRMQIGDLEREISEYEDLKEGRLLSFGADDLDSWGELLTKARIACGLTQAELGEILGMTQQQVQRYERDGWQKISLWRLAEASGALGLDLSIRARLPASTIARAAGAG
jgi:DNA-binding XRE family transcriptional regulator